MNICVHTHTHTYIYICILFSLKQLFSKTVLRNKVQSIERVINVWQEDSCDHFGNIYVEN